MKTQGKQAATDISEFSMPQAPVGQQASNFANRIVTFDHRFNEIAYLIDGSKDSSDVFKALNDYTVLWGNLANIKPLLRKTALIGIKNKYKQIAYTHSSLEQIVKTIRFKDNPNIKNQNPSEIVTDLLTIYHDVMSMNLNQPTAAQLLQLETAADLIKSTDPTPGAPETCCSILSKISCIMILLLLFVMLAGKGSNRI